MVDYIKMTQQASDMLNHQDMQMSGALSQERAKVGKTGDLFSQSERR